MLGLDQAALLFVCRRQVAFLTPVMRALTRIGDTRSWIFMGLALMALVPGGVPLGLRLAAGALGATLPVQILKRSLRRARPDHTIAGFQPLDRNPDAFSFPSGHTAAAFGVALSFLAGGSALAALALPLAVGIAVSRVYLGAHYPLDVVAGALLGLCGAVASILLLG